MRRASRGQAAVEFALVLPLMALLLLGIIDFGRVFVASNTLTQASREADRYASLNWNDGSGIESRGAQVLTAAGISTGYTTTITYLDGGGAGTIGTWVDGTGFVAASPCPRASCAAPIPGDLVQVQVTLPWSAQTSLIQAVLPADFTLRGTSVSVIEQ